MRRVAEGTSAPIGYNHASSWTSHVQNHLSNFGREEDFMHKLELVLRMKPSIPQAHEGTVVAFAFHPSVQAELDDQAGSSVVPFSTLFEYARPA